MLDIGLDTFVFIDDEPFERGEVGAALPMVTVLPEQELPDLLASPLLDVPATAEGSKRRKMYQVEELRQATFAGSGTDYLSFLRGCNIELDHPGHLPSSKPSAPTSSRSAPTSSTSPAPSMRGATSQPSCAPTPASPCSCSGAPTSSATTASSACACWIRQRARVQSFMMSCRVQRKRVEPAFFAWLTKRIAADRGVIEVAYRKTARNGASVRMLEELGFEFRPAAGQDEGLYVRPAREPFADDNVVHVDDRTKVTADAA